MNKRKNKSLNIAIIHLAFIYSGGGEKLVLEQYKGLKEKGHKVTIYTPVLNKSKCFPDIIDQFKIKTFLPNLPFFVPQREVLQVLIICLLIPLFTHRFRDLDIILAANQPSLWLAWVIKKLRGVPYVAYLAQPTRFLYPRKIDKETGLFFTGKRGLLPATFLMKVFEPIGSWVDKVSIKGSNFIFANGKNAKNILERTYRIKATSCPAGAHPVKKVAKNTSRVRKGKLRIGEKTISTPYILITNRHFPQKRFEYAIIAMPAILQEFSNVTLVITGKETNYTQILKNLVRQLSLVKSVVFLGLVKEKDLHKLYSNAAVYVYTAPEEDFGMGVVEAMSHATPVVAWNAAGPSGVIRNGKTGLLAKPYEAGDFAIKIKQLLKEKKYADKIGKSAWKEVKDNYSYKNHINILEKKLLEEVIK